MRQGSSRAGWRGRRALTGVAAGLLCGVLASGPVLAEEPPDHLAQDIQTIADQMTRRCASGLVRAAGSYASAWGEATGAGPYAAAWVHALGAGDVDVEAAHAESCRTVNGG